MKVRLKRPVFAEVTITAIAHLHRLEDQTGATEVTTTSFPKGGSVAVPFDHDELPILTAEQVQAPRELRVGATATIVHPPDWIVTSASGESLPCGHQQFSRLFEEVSS